jgi:hypothetical protein
MIDAALMYQKANMEAESNNTYVRKGTLKNIVDTIETERGIKKGTIPIATIRSRVMRNNVTGKGPASISPLHEVEPLIVDYCIKLARMGSALLRDQVMTLAEDIIEGTIAAKKLVEFKRQRGLHKVSYDNNDEKAIVGKAWYKNFMQRNKHLIKRKGLKVRDRQRLTYCTYPNFLLMYETVYEDMVVVGAATRVENKVLVNLKGEIVETEEESDGLPTNYVINNPELIVFVDETGCNTNQKTDPLRGNQKHIVGVDGDGCGLAGVVNDNHFTVLCFQSGNGEPIMCAIIFKSDRKVSDIPDSWKTGIDIRKLRDEAIVPGQEEEVAKLYIEFELGEDGALGGGPVCTFRGKKIKTFCTCSPNASISSSSLTEMLRYMDSQNIFDRANGEKPVLVLDGHHSRMDLEFLEYINDEDHKWFVCIGVPYGTHKWQVADSSQVNGKFKIELAIVKSEYLKFKGNNEGFVVSDIVPLVRTAFARSFANVENTRKAIAERGWGPALNYRLLMDKSLSQRPKDAPAEETESTTVSTGPSTVSTGPSTESTGPSTVSTAPSTFTTGTSALSTSVTDDGYLVLKMKMQDNFQVSLTDALLDHRNQEEGRAKAVEEKTKLFENKAKHIEVVRNLRKLTSGQLMSNQYLRCDENLRDNRRKRKDEDEELRKKREEKKQKQNDNQQQRYQTAINKCITTKQALTVDDYIALVKQSTEKGDSPVRKGRVEIMKQLDRRLHRLQRYLPSVAIDDIKDHLSKQQTKSTKSRNKNKTNTPDALNNQVGIHVPEIQYLSTVGTDINESILLENYEVGEDVAVSLLSLASGERVFHL